MQVCICEHSALRGHRKVLNSLPLELQAAIRHLMLVLRVSSGSSTRAVWAPYHGGPYPTDHCAFKKNIVSVHSPGLTLRCSHLHSLSTSVSVGPGCDSILLNKPECDELARLRENVLILLVSCEWAVALFHPHCGFRQEKQSQAWILRQTEGHPW